jgi:aspartate kinase
MGRESSDYSASIIGAALNAHDIQIWTDVDGILTADPRVVSSPKKIRTLSFEEAFELSYFGAKVLHPDTMLPAIEKNIPIHVFNSKRPHLSGTLVTSNSHADNHAVVKSVAYKRNVTIFTMTPRKRFSQFIFWEHIYSIFTKHRVAASLTVTSEYNVSIVLDGQKPAPGIIHDLEDIGFVRVFENKGILSIVGSNIQGTPHIIEKIFQSISDFGISMVSFGASKSSVSIIIDDEHILDAVRRIHRDFFEGSNNENVFEALEHISAQA